MLLHFDQPCMSGWAKGRSILQSALTLAKVSTIGLDCLQVLIQEGRFFGGLLGDASIEHQILLLQVLIIMIVGLALNHVGNGRVMEHGIAQGFLGEHTIFLGCLGLILDAPNLRIVTHREIG